MVCSFLYYFFEYSNSQTVFIRNKRNSKIDLLEQISLIALIVGLFFKSINKQETKRKIKCLNYMENITMQKSLQIM
jgi:hypothetical protein